MLIHNLFRYGALIGIALLITSCTSLRPLSASRMLDNYDAKGCLVIVPSPFKFKPGLVTNILPAGTYTPVLEDDEGIYFQSPSKILIGGLFGPTLHDGGLFFKEGISSNVYAYVITDNAHSVWKIEPNFKFTIEKKP